MQFEGAVVKEQGVTFAIVVVKPYIINSASDCDNTRNIFITIFPGMPIILMAQDSKGIPTYQGRTDIVRFLAKVSFSRIPWKKYNYS